MRARSERGQSDCAHRAEARQRARTRESDATVKQQTNRVQDGSSDKDRDTEWLSEACLRKEKQRKATPQSHTQGDTRAKERTLTKKKKPANNQANPENRETTTENHGK